MTFAGRTHLINRRGCVAPDLDVASAGRHPYLLDMRTIPLSDGVFAMSAVVVLAAFLHCNLHAESTAAKTGAASQSAISRSANVRASVVHDVSPALSTLATVRDEDNEEEEEIESEMDLDEADLPLHVLAPQSAGEGPMTNQLSAADAFASPPGSAVIEQTEHGSKAAPELIASFDGLGEGFTGPQGTARFRNPSDNTLAVGPDHIVQIVNSRMAIFTKKGKRFDATGRVLYGPVETRNVFKGFADAGEINNGDAVVRYDQLADRWLIVMPIFRRLPARTNELAAPGATMAAAVAGGSAQRSQRAITNQPGAALRLHQPTAEEAGARGGGLGRGGGNARGSYAMCYAISTSPDPLGSYYRYQFLRPLFPDYPRPAVWPDGYYVPTSSGDNVIQKQAFVVDRNKMLKGEDATEQGIIIDGVNFLNNADLDGKKLPPKGAPNIMVAAGGTQLKNILEDDGIYVWKFHVDWDDPSKTKLDGPVKITVAPYHYMGGGQLTAAVPQPGTDQRLDSQGDKIMSRLVYRRIGSRESIVAVHSVNTTMGGGGVRWYEFRLDKKRDVLLYQQGTYCPQGYYRWMASPAMDADGNIGIGYSFGGPPYYPGQRFAGRLANDPLGKLTLREVVLAEGEASQTNTRRWMDYAQTAVDPSDDRTIWYVGDYLKKGGTNYSTRIGAFRLRK
jgi:hypothetical protein